MRTEILKKIQKINNEILKKIQDEGLAILKLHEKLKELKIDHEFIDRKAEQVKRGKENEILYFLKNTYPFEYQIFIEENGNKISLIQSPMSYGIRENLIEVYNFKQEPVILDHEMAAVLINKKKLNSYIIAVNEKNVEELDKLKEILQLICESED